ncbi:hypothetical protein ACWEPL_40365 [Nonomuraea sp. NPDC004186]
MRVTASPRSVPLLSVAFTLHLSCRAIGALCMRDRSAAPATA